MAVGTGQLVAFSRGVAALDPSDSDDVYWAARACLLSRHEDTAAFDRAFRRWAGHAGGIAMKVTGELPRLPAVAPRDDLGSIRRRLEFPADLGWAYQLPASLLERSVQILFIAGDPAGRQSKDDLRLG